MQLTGVDGVHTPLVQMLGTQRLALQFVPSACIVQPALGLQVPEWHASTAQTIGVPAQVPPVQTSPRVQALPSSHTVPFAAAGFEHMPVVMLHVPTTWHWSILAHTTGLDPVQVPAWQL
jgi:hypothetical protein